MRQAARARPSAAPGGTGGAGGGRGAGHLTSCFPARRQTQLCGGISLPPSVPLSLPPPSPFLLLLPPPPTPPFSFCKKII